MSVWAIVPVKPFNSAKSRLAPALAPAERQGFSRGLLEHTLDVLAQARGVDRVLVVSRDSGPLTLARSRGAHTVTESGAPELNNALNRASRAAVALGARAVLILPIDLPLLCPADVERVLSLNGADRTVVIAPDRHGSGTNALVVRPPLMFAYAFGPDSYRQHHERAVAAGARVETCNLPGIALDVDDPDDLALYRSMSLQRT